MSKINRKRREAQDLIKKGKLKKAIDIYRKIISRQANNPNMHNELGDIYFRAGDRVQAVSSFENAIENYEKMGLYNNAVAVCKKVLRIFPERLITIYELGELKSKQGFDSDAAKHFKHYLNMLVSNSNMPPEGVQERLELIIEYMKGRNEVLLLVADAFESLEMKMRAAEVCVTILENCGGGSQESGSCRDRLERLKNSLSPDQVREIDKKLNSEQDNQTPRFDDEMDIEDVVSEKMVGSENIIKGSGFVDQGQPGQSHDEISEMDITEDREEAGGAQEDILTGGEGGAGSERVTEEVFPPPELDEEDAEVHDITSEAEEDEEFENFEDIVSGGADSEDNGGTLAEQITSDIDEGDLKSHYDMGMAYIEMQLFDEAIKELQVSSRANEMKLSSLEMIGLCFISKNEPHLAVKQLERGLAIADDMGRENLGIHYNLGLAYESLNDMDKAREHFEQVYIVDVTFRDIEEKMKKIRTLT